jgi:hypothetical protein
VAHKKKVAGLWRKRFLGGLARSANARLAAERAGVDHSTAYLLRKQDSGFALAWRRALAWGRMRTKAEGRPVFPGGRPRPARNGEAADPRPLKVVALKEGGTRHVRIGEGRWGPGDDDAFFEAFERTGSLRQAAKAAGFSTNAVHQRRRANPGFARRWQEVKEQGREGNEMTMIHAVGRTFDPDPEVERAVDEAAEAPPRPTVAEAIRIAQLFQRAAAREAARQAGPKEPPIEAVRDEVLARLAAIRAHRAARPAGEGGSRGPDE